VPASKLSRRELVALNPRSSARPLDIVHIASLLVQATPQGVVIAKAAAAALPGAEIHDTSAPGKFVVVLESVQERAIADAADTLLQVAGVLTVSVVAHLMESAADLQQEA
jgi:periplasmic nitrate reductase NapD